MKPRPLPSAVVSAVAVLLALTTALVTGLAFDAVARPSGYKARLRALQQSADDLRQSAALPTGGAYDPKAVCQEALIPAAAHLQRALTDRASAAGATLKGLTVTPTQNQSAGLAPIEVTLSAEGSYPAMVQLTALLQSAQPEVFVDSLDLKPTPTGAAMRMTGRAFCWSARP